ncbi:hypothetical protein GWK16_02990 [Roseomonas sp. JC162]|uniref:HdeD family acid-resistance protein n=1 Tax=Neoroseomonas marina TaxID=1232220 RepID=A0A848E7P2_9PROT|nr:DUF308 domain-containing protein [Neoroseomonas marina]NMJ40192.1 hypothetical protein [Neoroseomonas marina]
MSDTSPGLPGHGTASVLRGMAHHWWVFALRGAAAIVFAVLTIMNPGLSLFVLLAFLAAWLAVDGIATIAQAIAGKGPHGAWNWLDGLLSLAAAVALVLAPGLSLFMLVLMAGAFAVAAGVIRLVLAFRAADVMLGAFGAITVLFGGMLLAYPGSGLIAIAWIVALEAAVMGIILLVLGFRLRRLNREMPAR